MIRHPHIHVLVPGNHSSIDSLTHDSLASIRMRSAFIARAAESSNWRVSLGEKFDLKPDVLYVGKIGAHQISVRGQMWINHIHRAKANGSHIVIDYTDHHCGFTSEMTAFYVNAIPIADTVVTPSTSMATLIKTMCERPPIVISDPCEVTMQPPRAPGSGPWRALWFGSPSNINYLIRFLAEPSTERSIHRLNIVTNKAGMGLIISSHRDKKIARSIDYRVYDWSLPNLHQAARDSDIAVIPSDPSDPRKQGVSENRLITAIALGLPTLADLLPAYLSFKEFFLDLRENPFSLLNDPEIPKLVLKAQNIFESAFSPTAVLTKWTLLLDGLN